MTTAVKAPRAKRAPSAKAASKGDFAVLATGGKQYLVHTGDLIKVEKLAGDHKEGDVLTFDTVLLTGTGNELIFGNPFIKGSTITATLTKISRYKTIDVIKYKQKSRYFKKYGHRQPYFQLTIDSIK
jgi:large subunit ribosomal protein L21